MRLPMPVPPTMPLTERKPPPIHVVSSGVRSGLVRQALGRTEEEIPHDVTGWLVLAFAVCVLSVGWAGVFAPAWNASLILSGGSGSPSLDEPLAMEAETAPEPPADEQTTQEIKEVEVVEELPDEVPVEEVFEVPDAPDLVTVQRALEPEAKPAVKPETKPKRAPLRPPSPRPAVSHPNDNQPSPGRAATPSPAIPGQGTGSGTGSGNRQGGGSAKKAKTPQPPYPGFARTGRMSGTVVVSILVDASGAVISANVVRSCGFPQLDNYTSSYIRSRWHWPEGASRTFTQPVSFRLK